MTAKIATPPQTEGPFYPTVEQSDKDADLTKFGGSEDAAIGEIMTVERRVLGNDGAPIANTVVDIWQANAAGRYAHEAETNTSPLDPNFQGWAIMKTDDEGRYRFKSIKPGPYPVSEAWDRPLHIHFKVSKRGYHEITTQMYFENEALNEVDALFNRVPEKVRAILVATQTNGVGAFSFDVGLSAI